MQGKLTGRHATLILVGFFAVVIAVNITMARLATSTFGGKLADNGYVASQDYNKWIAAARAQDQLGWSVAAGAEDGHLVVTAKGVENAQVTAVANHPLGLEAQRVLAMEPTGPATARSRQALPPGRWKLHLTLQQGGRSARFSTEVRI